MSSYDCVLPIDFDCFQNCLLPDALRVLSGEIGVRDFVKTYVSRHVEGSMYEPDFDLDSDYVCSPEYVKLFARPMSEWKTAPMSQEPAYLAHLEKLQEAANNEKWMLSCWDYILSGALQQTCAVELPGKDLVDDTHDGYYSRLFDYPDIVGVQVAGAKNGWRFLNEFYDGEWLPDKYVTLQTRRADMPVELFSLLESLFFGVRCLPGLHPRQPLPSWPAHDDLEICGYLTPKEVAHLASFLPVLKSAAKPDDELFPVFADRLQRSAKVGAGLITIQSGL